MNDRLRLILLVMALSVTVALTGCSQPEQNSSIAADDNTTSLQSSIDTVTDTSKTGSITAPEGSELVKTLTDNNNNTVDFTDINRVPMSRLYALFQLKITTKNRFSK